MRISQSTYFYLANLFFSFFIYSTKLLWRYYVVVILLTFNVKFYYNFVTFIFWYNQKSHLSKTDFLSVFHPILCMNRFFYWQKLILTNYFTMLPSLHNLIPLKWNAGIGMIFLKLKSCKFWYENCYFFLLFVFCYRQSFWLMMLLKHSFISFVCVCVCVCL